MNAADEPLEHTHFKTTFTELQEACVRADGDVHSSTIEVIDFAFRSVLAFVAGDTSSTNPLRHNAEMSELQMIYDRVLAQSISVSSQCDIRRLLVRKRGTDTFAL